MGSNGILVSAASILSRLANGVGLVGGAAILILSAAGCDGASDYQEIPGDPTLGGGGSVGAGGEQGTGDDLRVGDDEDTSDPDATGESIAATPRGFEQVIEGGGTDDGYQTFNLAIDGDSYNVQTNPWGGAEQTITAGGEFIFRVDAMQEPAGGNPWDVAAFPSVYRGKAQGGGSTPNSGMPIQASAITSVATGLSTNSTSSEFTGNTTYDVYFTDVESYTSGGPDVYLMVWFDSHGLNPINGEDEQWNCRSNPPTHIDSCSDAGSLEVGGLTFYRFVGSNGHADVISYVAETPMDEWEFDLEHFIDDAVDQGVVQEDQYLQSIQAGFELVSGGVGLTVDGFYADVQ
jgi:hypothetical protein